jgi:transcription initiation factor IIE alpha subunit
MKCPKCGKMLAESGYSSKEKKTEKPTKKTMMKGKK